MPRPSRTAVLVLRLNRPLRLWTFRAAPGDAVPPVAPHDRVPGKAAVIDAVTLRVDPPALRDPLRLRLAAARMGVRVDRAGSAVLSPFGNTLRLRLRGSSFVVAFQGEREALLVAARSLAARGRDRSGLILVPGPREGLHSGNLVEVLRAGADEGARVRFVVEGEQGVPMDSPLDSPPLVVFDQPKLGPRGWYVGERRVRSWEERSSREATMMKFV